MQHYETSKASRRLQLLLQLTFLGGIVGAAVSIIGGLLLESYIRATRPGGPLLSYGQEFGFIIVPLCILIGAATGFSLALACLRHHSISVSLLLATAFVGWGITSSLWNSQIAEYGRDPSETVLYFPPAAMYILALVVAAMVVVMAIIRDRASRIGIP